MTTELKYSAASAAWYGTIQIPSQAIVVPQIWTSDITEGEMECGSASNRPIECSDLIGILRNEHWLNENLDKQLDARAGDASDLQPLQCLGQEQALACALESGVLCVLYPGGLRLSNNEDELRRFGVNNTDESLQLRVRLTYVTYMSEIEMYIVHSVCQTLRVSRPQTPVAALSFQNECVRRGLKAPTYATMRLIQYPLGAEICTWECRPDYVRWPWNADPLPDSHLSVPDLPPTDTQLIPTCKPIPEKFISVEFAIRTEVRAAIVIPELLTPEFVRTLDSLALLLQREFIDSNPDIRDAVVLLTVEGSVYHTRDLPSIIADSLESRGSQTISSINIGTPQRRKQYTTDVEVKGLAIISSVYLSPKAVFFTTSMAVQDAIRKFTPPAETAIMNLKLKEITSLSEVDVKKAEGPTSPPFMSDSRSSFILVSLVVVALTLCICVQYIHWFRQ